MVENHQNTLFKYYCGRLLKRLSKGEILFLSASGPIAVFCSFFLMPVIRFSGAITLFILFLITGCQAETDNISRFSFRKMVVEYSENPINIDESHPRFSWIISSNGRNQVQSACRILVASSIFNLNNSRGDLWDSEWIESGETIQHEYGNNNLQSNRIYYWRVIVRTGNNQTYKSPVAKFETSLLAQSDWQATWIGKGSPSEPLPQQGFYKDIKEQFLGADSITHDGNSLLLRREIGLKKKIRSARAFVTGVGFYEFFINGNRVGDHVLAPAKTPYHKYILYDTYDITPLLRQGNNALGIHLGNGWYNPYKKWWNDYRMQWFGSKKAIAQIHVTYTDGTTQLVTTDKNWLWAPGPVTYNCVYDGEVYDANLAHQGWTKTGYDASLWKPVTVFDQARVRLASHRMPPVKVNEHFKPVEVEVSKAGMKVYDMGQNFAGWVRIKVQGKKNTVLKIRFAEDLYADGTIDVTSNEHAKATAEYVMKGGQPESYEPSFTWFGFRYVEITALDGPLNILDFEGRAVYSCNSPAGQFECHNPLVNKIHKATVWSQKSNMMGYPMDCPQRDERLGWFGDAQVTAEEAMFNFDMALFYENWFEGIRENMDEKTGDLPIISPRPYIFDEGIEWSSTYFTMLWQFYNCYGDRRILQRHYPAMKRYMGFLEHLSKDLILPKGWIGDWGSMVKGWKEGEPASVPTAFYYLDATIMSDVARILGNDKESRYYKTLSEAIRDKYNKCYLNTMTASYNDGSQMANSFPLYLGIVPENIKSRVLDNLVNDIVVKNNTHLTTGVLGTKYMPEALARLGRADVAWEIINQKSAPGWNDMMSKYTTMCEFWTLKQSKNHVMMGSIDAWFYKYIAGIQPDENFPAFASFVIKPLRLDSLGSAKADIETIRGTISSVWKRMNGHFSLKVEVPFNTTAMVYIPGNKGDEIMEGGLPIVQAAGVEYLGFKEGANIIKVHSGCYSFTAGKN
jgi:alpha-L-rhamnosidase